MRFFYSTTEEGAEKIWRKGWKDNYSEFGMTGVWLSDEPDPQQGVAGAVILCLDLPEETCRPYLIEDPGRGYKEVIIPSTILNQLSKPHLYDHIYAGSSRRDLLRSLRAWEAAGGKSSRRCAKEMRKAMKFFDRHGWRNLVRLREEEASQSQ